LIGARSFRREIFHLLYEELFDLSLLSFGPLLSALLLVPFICMGFHLTGVFCPFPEIVAFHQLGLPYNIQMGWSQLSV
jgi:hypothetical protein